MINMAVYGTPVPDGNNNAASAIRIKNKIGQKNQAALFIPLIHSDIEETFCETIGQHQQGIDGPGDSAQQKHAVKLGLFFVYNGNHIKIIHQSHERRQYEIHGSD